MMGAGPDPHGIVIRSNDGLSVPIGEVKKPDRMIEKKDSGIAAPRGNINELYRRRQQQRRSESLVELSLHAALAKG